MARDDSLGYFVGRLLSRYVFKGERTIGLLDNQDSAVRCAACLELGRSGDVRAVEPLIRLLRDGYPRVRQAASQALGELGDLQAVVVRLGDMRAVGPLIDRLRDQDSGVRQAACQALARLGDTQAVEPLVKRLADKHLGVRKDACEALARLGEGRLAQAVVGAVELRAGARHELALLAQEGDLRAAEPLIGLLGDRNSAVADAAWEALGEVGDVRSVTPLVQRLGRGDADVRHGACRGLARLTDVLAVDPLRKRLTDDDSGVRYAAFRALESIEKAVKDPQLLFCRSCLAAFHRQDYRLERVGTVTIPVCRLCGRAADAIPNVTEVIAGLDREMDEQLSCIDGVARVSYLKRDASFDFDRVEIVRAGDYEVERFCVQVGNDADPFRKGRYRKMRCVVAPGCRLSENTLRILKSMFGRVDVRV